MGQRQIKPFHSWKGVVISRPKIGKTTFFSQFPEAIILDTEEGAVVVFISEG